MSEEILKVFLSDLQTIRVTCSHCRVTMEMSLANLADRMRENKCPIGICGEGFSLATPTERGDYNAFVELEKAIRHLNKIDAKVKVEFSVKVPSRAGDTPAKS